MVSSSKVTGAFLSLTCLSFTLYAALPDFSGNPPYFVEYTEETDDSDRDLSWNNSSGAGTDAYAGILNLRYASTYTVNGNYTLTGTDNRAARYMRGIRINGAKGIFNGDLSISGSMGAGIALSGANSVLEANGKTVITIEGSGGEAYGVYLGGAGTSADFTGGLEINVKATDSSNVYGIYALAGANANLGNNVTIKGEGNAYGVYGSGSGASVTMGDNVNITTEARAALYTTGGGTLTAGNDIILISGSGNTVVSTGANSQITLGDRVKITKGADNYAVLAQNGGTVNIGSHVEIEGEGVAAIYVSQGSNVTMGDEVFIKNTSGDTSVWLDDGGTMVLGSNVRIEGHDGSRGILINGDNNTGKLTAGDDLNVVFEPTTAAGRHAIEVRGTQAHQIIIGDNLRVTTHSNNNYAVQNFSTHADSLIQIGDNAVLETHGTGSGSLGADRGAHVVAGNNLTTRVFGQMTNSIGAQGGSHIEVGDNLKIYVNEDADNSRGILSSNLGSIVDIGVSANIYKYSGGEAAIVALNGGTVNLGADAYIETDGAGAYGLFALNDADNNYGSINTTGPLTVITKDANSIGIRAAGGEVNLGGETTVIVDRTKTLWAINVNNGGNANLTGTITGDDKMRIEGSLLAGEGGEIDLTMHKDSVFIGHTFGGVANNSILNLKMADSNWYVEDVQYNDTFSKYLSKATSLDLKDSVIDFTRQKDYIVQETNSFTADGSTFKMKVNVASILSDQLHILEEANAGDNKLYVPYLGGIVTTGEEVVPIVFFDYDYDLANGAPTDFELSHIVEAGAYQYGLRYNDEYVANGDSSVWELFRLDSITTEPKVEITTYFNANYLLGFVEQETLLQRMGDLRTNADDEGVWAKFQAGRFKEKAGRDIMDGYKSKYYGIQVGYDQRKPIEDGEKGDLYLGGVLSYLNMDVDLNHGDADIDRFSVGAYATRIHPEGWYWDAVGRYGWIWQDYDLKALSGERFKSDTLRTHGYLLSLEVGRRWFPESAPEAFYLEPQAQITYQRYNGGTFKSDSGMRTKMSDFDSLITRIGLNVGFDEVMDNGNYRNIYLKGSWNKEHEADIKIRVNGTDHFRQSLHDDWWLYGAGITYEMEKKNERESKRYFYADIERSSGGHFRKEWGINAGYRISF